MMYVDLSLEVRPEYFLSGSLEIAQNAGMPMLDRITENWCPIRASRLFSVAATACSLVLFYESGAQIRPN